jgi:hypothetical protein
MKYSQKFEKDFKWYLSIRNIFNFDGNNAYFDKKGKILFSMIKMEQVVKNPFIFGIHKV